MWPTLVSKELVSRLQGKLAHVILTLLVAAFTGLLLAAFWLIVLNVPTLMPVIGSSVGSSPTVTIQSLVASNRGVFLFYALAICLLAAVFSIAPAVASSALTSERENDTFDLLLLSGLHARNLVVGKLVAAVLFVALLTIVVIPGFAIAWMFGGVSVRDVGLVLLLAFATLLFICAIGLLFSAVARTSAMAALYTYAAVYALALGSLLAYLIGASTQNESAVRPLLSLNPFVALLTIPDTLVTSLQQTLPFPYRPALDLAALDWPGQTIKYPRWLNTLSVYTVCAVLLAWITELLIDPCHPLRARFQRSRN
jgi:ABC-type transport system involved in multi-copper enzyme maturation permease subunit